MELQVLFEKKKKIGECKYNTKALKRSTDYCFLWFLEMLRRFLWHVFASRNEKRSKHFCFVLSFKSNNN